MEEGIAIERAFVAKLLNKFSTEYLRFLQRQVVAVLSSRVPHRERIKAGWDSLSYAQRDNTRSPSYPSRGDIKIYKAFLGEARPESRVLLLGSTPALRRLLHTIGVTKYVIADFSYHAILGSARLTPLIDTDREIWVKADWIDLPLPRSHFDYIVGDLVCTQIVPEYQDAFFQTLAGLLAPTGELIMRAHCCDDAHEQEEAGDIIRAFFAARHGVFRKDDPSALECILRDRLRDPKTQMTSPASIAAELLQYPAGNDAERRFLGKLARTLTERAAKHMDYVTQTERELASRWGKYFSLEDMQFAADYERSMSFPIYRLSPRP